MITEKLSKMYRNFHKYPPFSPYIHKTAPTLNIPHQNDIFVTINEPTLVCHYHPKSIAYIKIHTWYYSFYYLQQVQHHTEQFTAIKIFWVLSIYPSFFCYLLFQQLILLFFLQFFFFFPEYHIVGIMEYVAFSDWFLSLRNMHCFLFFLA